MTAQAANSLLRPAELRACTVSSDLSQFAELITEMESYIGEAWGDFQFSEASTFLAAPSSKNLEFIVLAIEPDDKTDLVSICSLIRQAKARNLATIVTAKDIPPAMLHHLMRSGARDFIPYPLPRNAFCTVINRLRNPPEPPQPIERPSMATDYPIDFIAKDDRRGTLLAVQSASGGAGATTFASNLAWELILNAENHGKRICLMDLDFQLGNVASALDLEENPEVFDLLTSESPITSNDLLSATQVYGKSLHVLCGPDRVLPLEILTPEQMGHLLDLALMNFDYVIVDIPAYICVWTNAVLERAKHHFLIKTTETKSEKSSQRLLQAMQIEGLPTKNLRHVLNGDPDFTPPEFGESVTFSHNFSLPFGGSQIKEAMDNGEPLAEGLSKNPLRLELRRLARSLSLQAISARLH